MMPADPVELDLSIQQYSEHSVMYRSIQASLSQQASSEVQTVTGLRLGCIIGDAGLADKLRMR